MGRYAWIINDRVNGFIDADESYIGMCGGEWVELDYVQRSNVKKGYLYDRNTNEFIDDGFRSDHPDNRTDS